MVRHGSALSEARGAAAERLIPAAQRAFARIGPSGLELQARYDRGAPSEADAFRSELARRRGRDRARGSATAGPHRDELALSLGGMGVRGMASQGQHRAVVLALELAEIEVVTAERGVQYGACSSTTSRARLDRDRTASLLGALRRAGGTGSPDDDPPGAHRSRGPLASGRQDEFSRCERDDRRNWLSGVCCSLRTAIPGSFVRAGASRSARRAGVESLEERSRGRC